MIEDFSSVNAERIDLTEMDFNVLVSTFCIEGPSVMKFELTVRIDGDAKNVQVLLMNDVNVVA